MIYRMVAFDKFDCTDESDFGTCRSFANAVVGVQLGGSGGLEPCPFQQKNKSAPFVVPSLY